MELELNDEEAAVLGEALECLITHPVTDDDTKAIAIDLSHFLLALAAGHFDDWEDSEQESAHQGIEPCTMLTNDPINW